MHPGNHFPMGAAPSVRLIGSFSLTVLLLLSPLVLLSSQEVEVTGQPVPEYQDASSGLPTADLWTCKLVFFDIDNDGTDDLISLGPRKGDNTKDVHVYKWDGGSWTDASLAEGTANIGHSSYGGHDLADLDNDGDWDIAVGSHGADEVNAYLRSFANTWIDASTGLQASQDAWDVDVGDYNSDGFLDLAVGGFWGMDLHVYAGNGQGQWIDQSAGFERGMASHIHSQFTDVNNDGNLDVISNLNGGTWCYLGDGNGEWTNSSEGLPDDNWGETPDYGDFNNDGFIDLAMVANQRVWAFEGDGTGNWSDRSIGLPTSYDFKSLRMADMNNDGFDDIVGLTDERFVELYLATGAGGWIKADTTSMQGNAQSWRLNVGDFDHNLHRDITAGFGTDDVAGYPGSIKVWRETTIPNQLEAILDFPNGLEFVNEGSIQFIRWRSAAPAGTGTRTVVLDYSTSGGGGPWTLIDDDLPDTGIYQWEVPEVAASGDCYIRISVTDEMGGSAEDMNDDPFGIGVNSNINHSPQITILSPSEENESADKGYIIEWNATDSDEDELSIDLYYDTDTNASNGIDLIVQDLQVQGEASYDWNTTEVDEGIYYIYGWVEDEHGKNASGYSQGTVNVSHDPGGGDPDPPENQPPTMEITQPDGIDDEDVDEEYTIRWSSDDQDPDTITIDLFFDDNDDSEDGKILIEAELSNSGSYLWNTSEINEGEYYILGIADDNNGSRVEDYSDGTLTISHPDPPPPPDENEEPSIEVTINKLDEFTIAITWDATDPDEDELTIDLYYDIDTDPDNGKISIAIGLENTGEHQWDISDIEEGDYYIYAVVHDGNGGEGTDHSDGFTIDHPDPVADFEITFFQAASASDKPGENVFIQAKVRNVGDGPGVGTLVFSVDNVSIQTVDLQLDPGEEKNHNSLWITVEGNHTITVEAVLEGDPTSENNRDSRMLFIVGDGGGKKDDDDDITAYLVAGGILVLVVLTGVILLISSRRKEGTGVPCPTCGRTTEHSHDEDDDYCWNCEEYVGEMPRR